MSLLSKITDKTSTIIKNEEAKINILITESNKKNNIIN